MYGVEIIVCAVLIIAVAVILIVYYRPRYELTTVNARRIVQQSREQSETLGGNVIGGGVTTNIQDVVSLPCATGMTSVVNVITGARRSSTSYYPVLELCTAPETCPVQLPYAVNTDGSINTSGQCAPNQPLCQCTNQLLLESSLVGVWESTSDSYNFNIVSSLTYDSANTQATTVPASAINGTSCLRGSLGFYPSDPQLFYNQVTNMTFDPLSSQEPVACIAAKPSQVPLFYDKRVNIQRSQQQSLPLSSSATVSGITLSNVTVTLTSNGNTTTFTINGDANDALILFNRQLNTFAFGSVAGVLSYRYMTRYPQSSTMSNQTSPLSGIYAILNVTLGSLTIQGQQFLERMGFLCLPRPDTLVLDQYLTSTVAVGIRPVGLNISVKCPIG